MRNSKMSPNSPKNSTRGGALTRFWLFSCNYLKFPFPPVLPSHLQTADWLLACVTVLMEPNETENPGLNPKLTHYKPK